MNRVLILLVVGVVLWFELFYIFRFYNPYPHGPIVDVPYRQMERHAARLDYLLHPSSAAKVAWERELKRMRGYLRLAGILKLGLLVAANGICIYYLVGHGRRKAPA